MFEKCQSVNETSWLFSYNKVSLEYRPNATEKTI